MNQDDKIQEEFEKKGQQLDKMDGMLKSTLKQLKEVNQISTDTRAFTAQVQECEKLKRENVGMQGMITRKETDVKNNEKKIE